MHAIFKFSCSNGPIPGGIHAAIRQHRIEPLMWDPAGQSIAFFNEETTVQAIMDRIMAEAEAAAEGVRAATG